MNLYGLHRGSGERVMIVEHDLLPEEEDASGVKRRRPVLRVKLHSGEELELPPEHVERTEMRFTPPVEEWQWPRLDNDSVSPGAHAAPPSKRGIRAHPKRDTAGRPIGAPQA